MLNTITEIFNDLPAEKILKLAKDLQAKILNDKSLIEYKGPDDFVTQADREIQEIILDYFEQSALAGLYNIRAEENLLPKHHELNLVQKEYILIIDPIDGTNSFCRGEQTWGCMVGVFERKKKALIYSWNLISTGEVYSTALAKTVKTKPLKTKESKTFDVFDYRYGESAKLFPQKLEDLSFKKYKIEQIQVTSHPSSVWAGSELFNGNLNGLLWLSKSKHYPDYDLIFIGALQEQGWQVMLGKNRGRNNEIQMLVVAENKQELELLKQIGLELSQKQELVFEVGTNLIE